MRTTVEFPPELLEEVLRFSGAKKKKEALRIALEDYIKRKKLERLLSMPGKIEIIDMTKKLEEIELGEGNN